MDRFSRNSKLMVMRNRWIFWMEVCWSEQNMVKFYRLMSKVEQLNRSWKVTGLVKHGASLSELTKKFILRPMTTQSFVLIQRQTKSKVPGVSTKERARTKFSEGPQHFRHYLQINTVEPSLSARLDILPLALMKANWASGPFKYFFA